MNCTQAHDLIHEMLDDEIAPAQCRELEEHLESCSQCGRAAKQLEAMMGGFAWLADQSQNVPSAAASQPSPERQRGERVIKLFWLWPVVGAAAAIVLIVVGLQLIKPDAQTRQIAQVDRPIIQESPTQTTESKFEFELVGESYDDYIPVVQESTNPRVHIVWLYKTTKVAQGSSDSGRSADQTQFTRS